jgi:hypothetical protein
MMILHARYHKETAPKLIETDLVELLARCPKLDQAEETKRVMARPGFSTINPQDMHDIKYALCYDWRNSP